MTEARARCSYIIWGLEPCSRARDFVPTKSGEIFLLAAGHREWELGVRSGETHRHTERVSVSTKCNSSHSIWVVTHIGSRSWRRKNILTGKEFRKPRSLRRRRRGQHPTTGHRHSETMLLSAFSLALNSSVESEPAREHSLPKWLLRSGTNLIRRSASHGRAAGRGERGSTWGGSVIP